MELMGNPPEKPARSKTALLRALHRDIGFFTLSLTLVYSLSGLTLIYRDTNFLRTEKQVEKMLQPGLKPKQLREALHLRGLQAERDGTLLRFQNGLYDTTSGRAVYASRELPVFLNAMCALHKTASSSGRHVFALLYSLCLSFLALSSFWMYPRARGGFKRGLALFGAGFLLALLLLL